MAKPSVNQFSGIQRRIIPSPIEMRESRAAEGDTSKPCLYGYAAKYNNMTVLYSSKFYEYREVIEPGFFDDIINDDVRALKNHDSNLILGRTSANTLTLSSDDTGLYFENEPDPEITYVSDLLRSVNRKEITQCSFAFTIAEQRWEEHQVEDRWIYTRYLIKGKKLYDVGPVTFPAYEDTEVDARSFEELQKSIEEWRKANKPKEETTNDQSEIQLKTRQRKVWLLERKMQ